LNTCGNQLQTQCRDMREGGRKGREGREEGRGEEGREKIMDHKRPTEEVMR
jgi:hypothetical protein